MIEYILETNRKYQILAQVQIQQAGVDSHLMSQMDSVFMLFYAGGLNLILNFAASINFAKLLLKFKSSRVVGSFFSGSFGDRYHAPTIVGIGLIGSGLAILILAVGFWTNFIAMDLTASHVFFLVSTGMKCYRMTDAIISVQEY